MTYSLSSGNDVNEFAREINIAEKWPPNMTKQQKVNFVASQVISSLHL